MTERNDKIDETDRDRRVRELEQQLAEERLNGLALETLIDVAERDLRIQIRRRSGDEGMPRMCPATRTRTQTQSFENANL